MLKNVSKFLDILFNLYFVNSFIIYYL
jgi:hypothetical protein